jgi:hypothetical protein
LVLFTFQRNEAAEMKFFGSVAAYTSLACEMNQEVREKLNMFNANEIIVSCRCNWLQLQLQNE